MARVCTRVREITREVHERAGHAHFTEGARVGEVNGRVRVCSSVCEKMREVRETAAHALHLKEEGGVG